MGDYTTQESTRKKKQPKTRKIDDELTNSTENTEKRKIKKAIEASRKRLSLDVDEVNEGPAIVTQRRRKRIIKDDDDVEGHIHKASRSVKLKEGINRQVITGNELESDHIDKESGANSRLKGHKAPHLGSTERISIVKEKASATGGQKRKPKPRNRVTTSENKNGHEEVSGVFQVDKEDILQTDETSQSSLSKIYQLNLVAPPAYSSQASDILFVEKKGGQGFLKEHKSRINKEQTRTNYSVQLLEEDGHKYTALDFMLGVHLTFRNVAMISHGLLAGMALSQCIFIYVLSENDHRILLENYYRLALPFQAVYYFLITISTVSILDRFVNISSGWSHVIINLLARPFRALAVLAYILALIFSISLAQLDDKISLYKSIPPLWNDTNEINRWKIINLLRMICAVIGWILVAVAPADDQTAKTIQSGIEKENIGGSTSTVRIELNTIGSTNDGYLN